MRTVCWCFGQGQKRDRRVGDAVHQNIHVDVTRRGPSPEDSEPSEVLRETEDEAGLVRDILELTLTCFP